MPNYKLGKIYQIVCLTTGELYIGSTTLKTLAERLSGHKRDFKQWKNGKGHYLTSFIILEKNNYQIELVEAFPCNSKDELNTKEAHYIKNTVCVNKTYKNTEIKPVPVPVPVPELYEDRFLQHHIMFKRLNREFRERADFPVRKYNSRYLIRDHYSPSLDRECSYEGVAI